MSHVPAYIMAAAINGRAGAHAYLRNSKTDRADPSEVALALAVAFGTALADYSATGVPSHKVDVVRRFAERAYATRLPKAVSSVRGARA